MIVIGLTGSIGMGKSTVAQQFAELGAKICSADALVHELLANDSGVFTEVKEHFPQAIEDGKISRGLLGRIVFSDAAKRRQLEAILHPRVQAAENHFIEKNRELGTKLVVLDIPLLFETGGQVRCDATVVVSAPAFIQRLRVMRRQGMTRAKFLSILQNQMPDKEKRKCADFVVATGLGKAHSFRQVKRIMKVLNLA